MDPEPSMTNVTSCSTAIHSGRGSGLGSTGMSGLQQLQSLFQAQVLDFSAVVLAQSLATAGAVDKVENSRGVSAAA